MSVQDEIGRILSRAHHTLQARKLAEERVATAQAELVAAREAHDAAGQLAMRAMTGQTERAGRFPASEQTRVLRFSNGSSLIFSTDRERAGVQILEAATADYFAIDAVD